MFHSVSTHGRHAPSAERRVVLVTGGARGIGRGDRRAVPGRRGAAWSSAAGTRPERLAVGEAALRRGGRARRRTRPSAIVASSHGALRPARRPGEQRGRLAARGRRDRLAALLRGDRRAQPRWRRSTSPSAPTPSCRRRPAGGVDRQHRQRERNAALAGHGRVRRGEGGAAQPDAVARGRVGAEGARQRRDPRASPDRAVATFTTATRRGSPPSTRRSRWAAWRRRTTSPRRAFFSPRRPPRTSRARTC